MIIDLDRQRIRICCPKCEFPVQPFFRQVKNRDVLVCGGCKANIQLVDHLGSYRKAQRKVQAAIDQLTNTLKSTKLNIRF